MSGQDDGPAPRRGFAFRPEGLISGPAAVRAVEAGTAFPLAGGPLAFSACEVVAESGRIVLPLAEARAWAARAGLGDEMAAAIARVTVPRPPFAGLSLDRPRIMGVVNVTPDSFSDGGDFADTETRSPMAWRSATQAPTSSTSAANPPGPAPSLCPSKRSLPASCR